MNPLPSKYPAEALSFVLGRNPGLRILDYGDPEVFPGLWQDGLKATTHSEFTHLVLCGVTPLADAFDFLKQPGMPPAEVTQHFTAYSWAAAFRLVNPLSSITIVIVAGNGHSRLQGAGADLRELFVSNEISNFNPSAICLGMPELSGILKAISGPASLPLSVGAQGMMRGIIQQHLLPNPEDHHKFGNIVGALMLSPERNPGSRILGGLFQALQPETKFDSSTDLPTVDEELKKRVATASPFILFDDMGSIWAPFIRRWVPTERLHIPEVTEASRSNLVERLKALAEEPVQRRRLNASDFGVAKVADGEPFVLLLDLRLFASSQKGREDEADFISALKESVAEVSKAKHLKWPQLSEDEFREVEEAWYFKVPHSPNFRKARSWLPRLISLIDPTLPIVIFSSTQDPEVLREFRDYGNIVTNFSKPMFRGVLGETNDWVGAATLAFEKALHSALKISSAQKLMWDIFPTSQESKGESTDNTQPPQEEVAPKQLEISKDNQTSQKQEISAGTQQQLGPPALVEIFIDETGIPSEQNFAVGALVLISGELPFDHADYRAKCLIHKIGLWGIDDIAAYNKATQLLGKNLRLPKGDKLLCKGTAWNFGWLEQKLVEIERIVKGQGATLLACSLVSKQHVERKNVASPFHPFHRYRAMIGSLLEAILFHCDPVRSAIERGASIAIDAANAANPAGDWTWQDLRLRFGTQIFEGIQGDRMCATFGSDDMLPVVTEVLSRNSRAENLAPKVVRARAAKLLDWKKCEDEWIAAGGPNDFANLPPKPLHYLADWIAHLSLNDWEKGRNVPTLESWFKNGFRQEDVDDFKAQLHSHRRWSQGAKIDAIRGWKGAVADDNFALTPRMATSAAKWIEVITADDLTTLFHSKNPS